MYSFILTPHFNLITALRATVVCHIMLVACVSSWTSVFDWRTFADLRL